MAKHVGIVGCSAEGASLCYRTLCLEAANFMGVNAHPEVSLHTHSLVRYLEPLDCGDLPAVGAVLLSSAQKLAEAGAEFAICPDNTMHQAFGFVAPLSPIPWLHIAQVVASASAQSGFRRVGLLGTRSLVESDVYPGKLAAQQIELVRCTAPDIAEVDRIIMEELIHGVFSEASTTKMRRMIEKFAAKGCDAVILGCTELPLVLNDQVSAIPTLDSTRLLARAALAFALRTDT